MEKRTKILATIGPASETEEKIEKLIKAGVNLFRFNLKHNDHSWHEDKINLVRKKAEELNKKIGIIIDLQGPDIRIGELSKQELNLGDLNEVYLEHEITEENSIQLDKTFLKNLDVKQMVLVDDGKHRLEVIEKISETKIKTKVLEGEVLTSKKSIFFPGVKLDLPALSEKDIKDIKLGAKVNAEFVALSFVRNKEDLLLLKKHLNELNYETSIISKIETLESVKKIDEILKETDAVMVARGDLGVEIFLEAVPSVQKRLIRKTLLHGKPVIVATQMLKSMVDSASPTRAEISDIANAAFDRTDAVMLSEESAIGKYPVKAVQYMAKALKYNEMENISADSITEELKVKSQTVAIVQAANSLQKFLKKAEKNPKYFLVLTESGTTAKLLSATRPELPILAFTQSEKVSRTLSLNWGVQAFKTDFKETVDESVIDIISYLKKNEYLKEGDSLVVTSGQNIGTPGQTDSVRVITV